MLCGVRCGESIFICFWGGDARLLGVRNAGLREISTRIGGEVQMIKKPCLVLSL